MKYPSTLGKKSWIGSQAVIMIVKGFQISKTEDVEIKFFILSYCLIKILQSFVEKVFFQIFVTFKRLINLQIFAFFPNSWSLH